MTKYISVNGKGNMLKKKWKKPELIVLVRGKPEEAVLTNCKGSGSQTDSGSKYSGCNYRGGCGGECRSIGST